MLEGITADCTLSIIDSAHKNNSKHMNKSGLQNELMLYHIHQQNLTAKTLVFKKITTDIICAVNFIKPCNLKYKF